MELRIDVTGKKFVVTQLPEQRYDTRSGEEIIDKATGVPVWRTQLVCTDATGGDVITVNTPGPPPGLRVGAQVDVVDLIAFPWAGRDGKRGIAYKARGIATVEQ